MKTTRLDRPHLPLALALLLCACGGELDGDVFGARGAALVNGQITSAHPAVGLLHLDVVQERLQREYDMSLILSAPSVALANSPKMRARPTSEIA